MISLLWFESEDSPPDWLLLSLMSLTTVPSSTPAFLTSLRNRSVYFVFVGVGIENALSGSSVPSLNGPSLFLASSFLIRLRTEDALGLTLRRQRFECLSPPLFSLLDFFPKLSRLLGFSSASFQRSHISHICWTVLSGINFWISNEFPRDITDSWQRVSESMLFRNIFAIFVGDI